MFFPLEISWWIFFSLFIIRTLKYGRQILLSVSLFSERKINLQHVVLLLRIKLILSYLGIFIPVLVIEKLFWKYGSSPVKIHLPIYSISVTASLRVTVGAGPCLSCLSVVAC